MNQPITHIKSVHIRGLWGRSDANFDWELNADVNVLSGDNGSGKSTILRLIGNLLQGNSIEDKFEKFDIIFNNNKRLTFEWEKEIVEKVIDYVQEEAVKYVQKKKVKAITSDKYQFVKETVETTENNQEFEQLIPSVFIANSETQALPKEVLQKFNDNINTNLDWEIDKLQRQFADYQITIGKRVIERLEKGENDVKKITLPKNTFFNIIDNLFQDTNKRIDRNANDIQFWQNENHLISPYQLSSGEKQMLILLLTALVQDNQAAITILDEPEMSLHSDWRKELITDLRKLNPNMQLIIATHSPFIIMDGWRDTVAEMWKIKTT